MKPPLVLDPPNRTPYTCAICGKRDKGTPNQVTCSDRCFREWRNRKLKAKRERERARLMAGRTVL